MTSQGYPVVIELSKTARKVVDATIGLQVKCQMPPDITLPDTFTNTAGPASLSSTPATPARCA